MPVPTQLSQLRALQALELAIRKGSLKAAAEHLSITPAAVGQRIKSLEQYLGYELITRGRTGIRPARELRPALAHLRAAFRELETVARLLEFQRVNEIHISGDSDWAQLWLLPKLADFRQSNPNVRFCVNGVGDVPVRLGHADCTVGFDVDESLGDVEPLHRDYLIPVTSPENAERIAGLPDDERLEDFPLLHIDAYTVRTDNLGWPGWVRRFGHRSTSPERGIRYQWVAQALESVYADAGLIICGLSLVHDQIDNGTLTAPFPPDEGAWTREAYKVAFHPQALSRSVVRHFRSWLLAEARKTGDAIASTFA